MLIKNALTSLLVASLLALGAVGCDEPAAPEAPAADEAPAAEEAAAEEAAAEEAAAEEAAADEAAAAEEAAGGQWVESDLYDVKFRVPDAWTVTKSDEGVSATDADATTTVLLAGSESQDLVSSTLNDLRADLEFKEVELEKSGLTTINGLAGMKGRGTAVLVKDEMDQEIQFLAYNLKVDKKTVTMLIFSEAEMYEAKKEMIEGIAQTIVKAK